MDLDANAVMSFDLLKMRFIRRITFLVFSGINNYSDYL